MGSKYVFCFKFPGVCLCQELVKLNDIERRNDRYFTFFPPNSVPIGADYVKMVEDTPIPSATEQAGSRRHCGSHPSAASTSRRRMRLGGSQRSCLLLCGAE